MALDGTGLDVADTQANADHFGHAGNDKTRSVFPELRLITLSEAGTHAVVAAQRGPWSTGGRTLAGLWSTSWPIRAGPFNNDGVSRPHG
ncbi:hypothetical protein [Nocardiopsis alkaliphila]|uniref:hypothetical protein n=1 Tax=Nocardiopsis alkaliphila TaxID=225762 RepID=UPI00034D8B2F|nr:hypothetical protein [Nocardiopsis alkaliphila]